MSNNIHKDYYWNTIGVFAQNLISPLLLIVITRINGINDSGLFSYAFSIAVIFWAIGMWGGRTFQASDIKQQFPQRSYVMMRLMLGGIMIVCAVLFAVMNQYDTLKIGVIVTLVLLKAIESVADALYGIMQMNNRLFMSGKSLLAKSILGFGAFVMVDVITERLLLACLSIVLVNVLVIFAYDLHIVRQLEDLQIKARELTRQMHSAVSIIIKTAPVFAVLFLTLFSLNIPRYFIDMYHESQIGYFGIIAMPVTLIGLIMTFILQPNVVSLSKLYETKKFTKFNQIVVRISGVTVLIGIAIFVVTVSLGVPVLNLIFGIDFSHYRVALFITVAGGVVNAVVSVLINVGIVMRQFKWQFYVLLISNVALTIVSALSIRRYGLEGGLGLYAITNVVQMLLLVGAYKRLIYRAISANNARLS